MRFLLDTNVFLWLQTDPRRLGDSLELIADPASQRLVSAVVAWEIAIKHATGRLPLPDPPARYVRERVRLNIATPVAVTVEHALGVADLPPLHRDPFDRLLVSQARALDAEIVTGDRRLAAYPVRVRLV